MCHLENNLLPVQSVIRTLVRKKLWKLEQPYPRSCMDNLRTNLRTNGFSKNCKSRKPLVLLVARGGIDVWFSNGRVTTGEGC